MLRLNSSRSERRKDGEEAWQPEYGSLVWLVQHGLRLCAPRVRPKILVHSLILLFLRCRPRTGISPARTLTLKQCWGRPNAAWLRSFATIQ